MPGVMDLVNQRGGSPMLAQAPNLDATKELLRAQNQEDFTTVLDFKDEAEATDFAACIFKCQKHGLYQQEKRFWLIAKARVAVNGKRADKYSMTLARLLVPEAYGGSSVRNNRNNGSDHAEGKGNA